MLLVSAFLCIFLAQDGTEVVVKHVLPGDSVHSLLSILDVITVKPIYSHLLYANVYFLPR